MGRDYRSFAFIMYRCLVVVAEDVFLSDLRHVLSAECVLGCGVEVAHGAEVLG